MKNKIPLSPEQLFESIMDHAPLLISAKDLGGNVIMANRHFQVLESYDPDNFVGKNVFDLFPEDVAEKLWNNDLAALGQGGPIYAEEQVTHKDGTVHTYHTVKFPLQDSQGQVCAICAISYDITDVKVAQKQSHEDELTQLYNRRFFNKIFVDELKRAKRNNVQFVLMLLDLDRFKLYNDTYGHESGDVVLAETGRVLREACHRASDLCFRIGGEEFAVISNAETPSKALELAYRIRDAISDLDINHVKNQPRGLMTCSIGVAVCDPGQKIPTQSQLYSLADKALYQAKDAGRDRVSLLQFSLS